MTKSQRTGYRVAREQLKSGDIALFSGKGGISSAIKRFTHSKWSHVGLIVRAEPDLVLLFESTTLSDVSGVDGGPPRAGVQLVTLSDRLARYGGEVTVRCLNRTLLPEMKQRLVEFRHVVQGRPYEESLAELIRSAWDGPFGRNTEDLSSLFCSELVAEAYQRMGLLPEPPNGPPSNEYTPANFSSSGECLHLQEGYRLAEEVVLL